MIAFWCNSRNMVEGHLYKTILLVLVIIVFCTTIYNMQKQRWSIWSIHGRGTDFNLQLSRVCVSALMETVEKMSLSEVTLLVDVDKTVRYQILKNPLNLSTDGFSSVCTSAIQRGINRKTAASKDLSQNTNILSKCFQTVMSLSEKAKTVSELERVINIFTSRGIFVIMVDGNLIGSLRYFGQLPWEGDLDIAVKKVQRLQVRKLVQEIHNNFTEFYFLDTEKSNGHLALYILCPKNDRKGKRPWSKCGRSKIDIFFYWNTSQRTFYRGNWAHLPLSDVFPRTWRPYDGHLLPVPRDSLSVAKKEFGSDVMETCYDESACPKIKNFKCTLLHDRYGFVKRINFNKTHIVEILVNKHKQLTEFFTFRR